WVRNCLLGASRSTPSVVAGDQAAGTAHVRDVERVPSTCASGEQQGALLLDGVLQRHLVTFGGLDRGLGRQKVIADPDHDHAPKLLPLEAVHGTEPYRRVVGGGFQGGGPNIASLEFLGRVAYHPLVASGHGDLRSEEHTSELQSRFDLVC